MHPECDKHGKMGSAAMMVKLLRSCTCNSILHKIDARLRILLSCCQYATMNNRLRQDYIGIFHACFEAVIACADAIESVNIHRAISLTTCEQPTHVQLKIAKHSYGICMINGAFGIKGAIILYKKGETVHL